MVVGLGAMDAAAEGVETCHRQPGVWAELEFLRVGLASSFLSVRVCI